VCGHITQHPPSCQVFRHTHPLWKSVYIKLWLDFLTNFMNHLRDRYENQYTLAPRVLATFEYYITQITKGFKGFSVYFTNTFSGNFETQCANVSHNICTCVEFSLKSILNTTVYIRLRIHFSIYFMYRLSENFESRSASISHNIRTHVEFSPIFIHYRTQFT
jgi:hypothetical protein